MLLLNPKAKKEGGGGKGWEVGKDQQIRPDCFQPQSYFLYHMHQGEGATEGNETGPQKKLMQRFRDESELFEDLN